MIHLVEINQMKNFIKLFFQFLKKYKVKDKDISTIANSIKEICSISYDNGSANEAFCNAVEYC